MLFVDTVHLFVFIFYVYLRERERERVMVKYKGNRKKGSFKQQIRGVERYLRRSDLSDESRRTQEKKLEDLKKSLSNRQRVDKEKKLSKQYHGIKFFEKKKLLRKRKQLQKKLRANAATMTVDEKLGFRRELQKVDEGLTYISFFPKGKKYVALFPAKDANNEKMLKKRAELLKEALENKRLDQKKKEAGAKGDYSDDEEDVGGENSQGGGSAKKNTLGDEDDFFA